MQRHFLLIAALLGFLSVGLGAFGTHALAEHFARFPQRRGTYETAVQYQMFAVVGLVACSGVQRTRAGRLAGWAFVVGTLLFCGSLYALALLQWSFLGAIAPFGGAAFLAGWGLLAAAVWQTR